MKRQTDPGDHSHVVSEKQAGAKSVEGVGQDQERGM